jgi:hypothetical protein
MIHAELEDGPRAGETVRVSVDPDGLPPAQLVIQDPLAPTDDGTGETGTTYRRHEQRDGDRFVYRTGSTSRP